MKTYATIKSTKRTEAAKTRHDDYTKKVNHYRRKG